MRHMDGRRHKHVTWSPIVVGVTRPSKRRCRARAHISKSIFTLHPPKSVSRTVSGQVTAHSRRSTHSVLVTIRNDRHRVMQLLVDLTEQRIRRIYDGTHSWTVRPASSIQFRLHSKLRVVAWADDGEERSADAPGFRLDWLNGDHTYPVTQCQHNKQRERGHLFRKQSAYSRRKKSAARRQRSVRGAHKSRA